MTTATETTRTAALRSIAIMADGDLDAFRDVVAEGAINREDANEPPDSRVGGPAGFHATALWLRGAFADLAHRVEHVVVEDDLVVVDTVMTGRHVGPFVTYDAEGRVDTVWAPTHRTFAVRQSHWLRVEDGLRHRALGHP